MESACFISLWPINGDAITVMEMDCCCQQPGLRAGRSFLGWWVPRTESERTSLEEPMGSHLGRPEVSLEGRGQGLSSRLWERIPRAGELAALISRELQRQRVGRWPDSRSVHIRAP